MSLELDEQDLQSAEKICRCCGKVSIRTSYPVLRDGVVHALALSCRYDHHAVPEEFIDVIFGTWGVDDADDHVTLGCRVEFSTAGQPGRAELVAAASVFGDSPLYGRKLSPDEAADHVGVDDFWQIVDLILGSRRPA